MPDLIDIPGIPHLWSRTKGDPGVRIAVIDGAVDLDRACFRGAALTRVQPYWQETPNVSADMRYIDEFNRVLKEDEERVEEYASSGLSMEEARAKRNAEISGRIPLEVVDRLGLMFHASHICSTIFGQSGSPVEGLAPRCTGFNIALSGRDEELMSPMTLARALDLALELDVDLIHASLVIPTQTGHGHELFERAVRQCVENDVLIVCPSGNDKGECEVMPACLPGVLAVGAMSDDGQPFKFSNWTGAYQQQGVLAPGQNILGAKPGTDEPIRKQGTSCAAPVMTGVAALLMSLQKQHGQRPSGEAVRSAILASAIPCDPRELEEPERCMRGKLNIAGAIRELNLPAPGAPPLGASTHGYVPATAAAPPGYAPATAAPTPAYVHATAAPMPAYVQEAAAPIATHGLATATPIPAFAQATAASPQAYVPAPTAVTPASIQASQPAEISMPTDPHTTVTASQGADEPAFRGPSDRVYAIGTLGYDFGTEARRDSFKQLMPAVAIDETKVPANPYDARQMVDYLADNPSEGKSLIWTLNLELTPIYAIEPVGAFAADVYDAMQQLLSGQVQAEHDDDYIERVSVPGRVTGRTAKLFSGQVVPVIEVDATRGMYGWHVNSLVAGAVDAVRSRNEQADEAAMRKTLGGFLQRVYYDLRNLGRASRERALNFAATNAFQAASTFADAVAIGMELDSISVEKSPFCRLDSDCWDVKLKFFDPENARRARRVFRFTIDVSDTIPVTLGEVRSWATPS